LWQQDSFNNQQALCRTSLSYYCILSLFDQNLQINHIAPTFLSYKVKQTFSQSKHLNTIITAESKRMGQKLQLHFRKGACNHDIINAFGYEAMKTINLVSARQF
jgi:hypothetical protein